MGLVVKEPIASLGLKAEAVEGVAETTGFVHGIRWQNLQIALEQDQYERNVHSENMGDVTTVPGSRRARITGEVSSCGAASLANIGANGAELSIIRKAGQWKETLVAST